MTSSYWQFGRSQWPLLFFGFCTVFWGNLGQSFFLSWFGGSIQHSLLLSAADYGLIYALATLASGFMVLWLGALVDRCSLAVFSLAVALALMVACVAMALAQSWWSLALGFFLLRLSGQALMPHTAQTAMLRYFPRDRGKAISIAASGVPVGEIILPLLLVALIGWLDWRYTWWLLAASVPLFYLPLQRWLLARAKAQLVESVASSDAHQPTYSRRQILAERRFLLLLPSVLANPFLLTGVFIQQPFLLREQGWSAAWLAAAFVAYGVVHWVAGMMAGSWVDRFNAQRLMPWILVPQALAMLSLVLFNGAWLAWFFMALMGCAIGVAGPITGALWAELYGTRQIGMVRSLVTSLMVFSTAAAPWLFGLVIDAGASGEQLYGGCLLALALAAGMCWRANPSPPQCGAD